MCILCILCVRVHCTAAYVRQFRRLPKHRQAVSYDDRSVQDELVTVEECARRCLLSVDRPCHGFNYKPAARYQPCSLLHATSGRGLLAVYADDTDFYQRQPGCTSLACRPIHCTQQNIRVRVLKHRGRGILNCDLLTLFHGILQPVGLCNCKFSLQTLKNM